MKENDFGFSLVDEVEVLKEASKGGKDYEKIARQLMAAITPLIANLKADPNKDYIKWPNRADSLNKFTKKLNDIFEGKA